MRAWIRNCVCSRAVPLPFRRRTLSPLSSSRLIPPFVVFLFTPSSPAGASAVPPSRARESSVPLPELWCPRTPAGLPTNTLPGVSVCWHRLGKGAKWFFTSTVSAKAGPHGSQSGATGSLACSHAVHRTTPRLQSRHVHPSISPPAPSPQPRHPHPHPHPRRLGAGHFWADSMNIFSNLAN